MEPTLLPISLQPFGASVLMAARLGGLLLVAPMFAARAVPTRVRIGILVALSVALHPVAGPASVTQALTPVSLLTETVIGLIVGLGAAIFIAGAETAGEWAAVQMGLAGATTVNPLSTESTPVLGNFLSMTAIALLLAVDGHIVMIEAVVATTDLIPLGGEFSSAGAQHTVGVLGVNLFLTGLRFAAPVVAVLLVVNVGLGILARTSPQLNLLMVAFPVQIGLGLLAFVLGLPLLTGVFGSWPVLFEDLLGRSMAGLGGAP